MNKTKKAYFSPWPIIRRHLFASLPYLDFAKLVNIAAAKAEEILGREKMSAKPYFIKLEPTNRCNLRCRGCLHAGDRQDIEKTGFSGDMDFELFKKIIGSLEKYLVKVSLYSMGEPLIYPRIAEMIGYLSERRIGSVLSSNMNYLPPELARRLVENKLAHLIVSLDGCEEATYQQYRQGGKLAKAIDNIKLILAEKKKSKSKYPIVEIQTINFSHISPAEMAEIKNLSRELGADKFTVKENVMPFHENPRPEERRCFWLYGHPSIKWDGTIQPCCYYYEHKDNDFGSLKNSSFFEVWNNEKYAAARGYFRTGRKGGEELKCHDCIFFKP